MEKFRICFMAVCSLTMLAYLFFYIAGKFSGCFYWDIRMIPYHFAIIVLLITFSKMEWSRKKLFSQIANDSFAIYLLHMPLAGIVANICNRTDSAIFVIVRSFVVLFLMELFLILYRKFCHQRKWENWALTMIGLR